MKQNTITQRLMFLKKFQWFIYSFIEIYTATFIRAVKMTVSVVLGGCSIISESWSPPSKLVASYTRLIKLGKVIKFQHPIYYEDKNNNKRNAKTVKMTALVVLVLYSFAVFIQFYIPTALLYLESFGVFMDSFAVFSQFGCIYTKHCI